MLTGFIEKLLSFKVRVSHVEKRSNFLVQQSMYVTHIPYPCGLVENVNVSSSFNVVWKQNNKDHVLN